MVRIITGIRKLYIALKLMLCVEERNAGKGTWLENRGNIRGMANANVIQTHKKCVWCYYNMCRKSTTLLKARDRYTCSI